MEPEDWTSTEGALNALHKAMSEGGWHDLPISGDVDTIRACRNCTYYRDKGCHRHAPVLSQEGYKDNDTLYVRFVKWPGVQDTDWCGEWRGC